MEMFSMLSFKFSVNSYDKDGDLFEKGIFLHLRYDKHYSLVSLKVGERLNDIDALVANLLSIKEEIRENYPDVQ